jgi:uncharacterized damage-inducible protein DinB
MIKHLGYSVWATDRLSKILEKADETIFKKELSSSFPTIEKTILHIWDAETIWMKRLEGESKLTWPSETFAGDRSALLSGWLASATALRDMIGSKSESYLDQRIDYKNMSGAAFSSTVEEILYHVTNHGTFHRGQIVTMLRTLGITEIPSTDLITYLRS